MIAIPRCTLEELVRHDPLDDLVLVTNSADGEKYWNLFDKVYEEQPNGDVWWLAEDISFCRRVRAMGRAVYFASRPSVGHVGQWNFTPMDAVRELLRTEQREIVNIEEAEDE